MRKMADRVFGAVGEGEGEASGGGDFTDENLKEDGVESITDLEGDPIPPGEGDPDPANPADPVLDFQKALTESGLTYKNEHELLTGHQNMSQKMNEMGNELGDLRKMGSAFTQLQDFYQQYFEDGGDGKLYLTDAALKEFSRNAGDQPSLDNRYLQEGSELPENMEQMKEMFRNVSNEAIAKQMEPFNKFMTENQQEKVYQEETRLNNMVEDHLSEAIKNPEIKKNLPGITKILEEMPGLYSAANNGKNPLLVANNILIGRQEQEARRIRLNKNPKGLHSLDAGVQGDGETNSSEENVLKAMEESGSAGSGVFK